ncbi:MAG: hypothetical protein LIQ31_01860 [Planctomycetes bacterium]|nr:hypothetical protein [Planctomycetota bacterium]
MSDEIKPIGLLYMWLLVTRGGDACLKDIRPACKPAYRQPLIDKGLVEETPEGRTKRLTLTDAGWHYLATHMTAPLQTMSAATSGAVLQGIFAALDRHLRERDINLAELFSPPSASASRNDSPESVEPVESVEEVAPGEAEETDKTGETGTDAREQSASDDDLWHRLARSWASLQESDEGIPLEKLRPAFPDETRERLDAALLEWQREHRIVIYPYDDGERITAEVKNAALRASGRDLHVIYQK